MSSNSLVSTRKILHNKHFSVVFFRGVGGNNNEKFTLVFFRLSFSLTMMVAKQTQEREDKNKYNSQQKN